MTRRKKKAVKCRLTWIKNCYVADESFLFPCSCTRPANWLKLSHKIQCTILAWMTNWYNKLLYTIWLLYFISTFWCGPKSYKSLQVFGHTRAEITDRQVLVIPQKAGRWVYCTYWRNVYSKFPTSPAKYGPRTSAHKVLPWTCAWLRQRKPRRKLFTWATNIMLHEVTWENQSPQRRIHMPGLSQFCCWQNGNSFLMGRFRGYTMLVPQFQSADFTPPSLADKPITSE